MRATLSTKSQMQSASAAGCDQNAQDSLRHRKGIHLLPKAHILLVDNLLTARATTIDRLRALGSSSALIITIAASAVAHRLELPHVTLDSVFALDANLAPAS